ncbi:hypothetical protein BDZ89DRAFT_1126512 [Hymenopellis radicata]|nr:hypothetical protein BDZ89DRAFT_1126512 [Hymenopellis radicata]
MPSSLALKKRILRRVLWADFYIDPKTKKAILKPFNPNPEKVSKITTDLNLTIPPRDLKSKDTRHPLSLIFSQWLSLSTCIIQAVVVVVPAPPVAQLTRIPKILYPDLHDASVEPKNKLEEDLFRADSNPDAYICATAEEMGAYAREAREAKAQAVATDAADAALTGVDISTPQTEEPKPAEPQDETEVILGFVRLYSGTVSTGDKICFVEDGDGRGYVRDDGSSVNSVRAGNIFAIKGLEGIVWRRATLCALGGGIKENVVDEACLINLGRVSRAVPPIVRVAVESVVPADMYKVRCLKDLRERFAKVEIQASNPIVRFRETTVTGTDMPPPKPAGSPRGTMKGASSQNIVRFTIRAAPLARLLLDFILDHLSILWKFKRDRRAVSDASKESEELKSKAK